MIEAMATWGEASFVTGALTAETIGWMIFFGICGYGSLAIGSSIRGRGGYVPQEAMIAGMVAVLSGTKMVYWVIYRAMRATNSSDGELALLLVMGLAAGVLLIMLTSAWLPGLLVTIDAVAALGVNRGIERSGETPLIWAGVAILVVGGTAAIFACANDQMRWKPLKRARQEPTSCADHHPALPPKSGCTVRCRGWPVCTSQYPTRRCRRR